MSEKSTRQGGGGKLSRTETVTVRFDPKMRYLAELAARTQHRTLSSFIEWAVEKSLSEIYFSNGDGTIAEASVNLWDVDEAERVIRLAIHHPELLAYEEQVLWKLLLDSRLLDHAHYVDGGGNRRWIWKELVSSGFPIIRDEWPGLTAVLLGSKAEQAAWLEGARARAKDLRLQKAKDGSTDDVPF